MTGIISRNPEAVLQRKLAFFRMVQNLKGINAAVLLKSKKFRHAVRFEYSERYLAGKVLEIGAGEVPLKHNAETVDYLDYAPKEIIASHFGVDPEKINADIVGSMTDIPASDCAYDTVAASHVLEHLEDPIKGLKECLRVVKEQGILFLVVPNAKTSEFDFKRRIFSVNHFIEEHNDPQILARNKLEHYEEFVDQTQFSRETSFDAFNERLQEFVQSDRRIHFHAYGPRLLITLVNYSARQLGVGVDVIDSNYHEYSNEILLVLRRTKSKKPIPENYLLEPSRVQKSISVLSKKASDAEGVPFL